MATFSNTSLMYLENLTFPKVQIVVVMASMTCYQCRERVARLLTRMTSGLMEYTVDVRGRRVVFKAETELPVGNNECYSFSDEMKGKRRRPLKWFLLVSSFLLFTSCGRSRRNGC